MTPETLKTAAPQPTADRTETTPAPEYRCPARFPVGEATELLRRNISGHLIDGTGGWYVWGS